MSRRNDVNKYFMLLDLLLRQTRFGNVTWIPGPRPYSYEFNGAAAGVRLESRDQDGDYPLQLAILDSKGDPVESYTTFQHSPPEEEFWDARVRALWEEIAPQPEDPVGSLIEELDGMPPF